MSSKTTVWSRLVLSSRANGVWILYQVLLIVVPLMLLLSPVALGQSQPNDPQLLPQAVVDEPFCFMQTTDGIVDLQRLCGSSTGSSTGRSGSSGLQNGAIVSRFRRNCTVMQCASGSQLRPVPLSSR
jgi:hypothetical protein